MRVSLWLIKNTKIKNNFDIYLNWLASLLSHSSAKITVAFIFCFCVIEHREPGHNSKNSSD
jgi:hypothetical protein